MSSKNPCLTGIYNKFDVFDFVTALSQSIMSLEFQYSADVFTTRRYFQ